MSTAVKTVFTAVGAWRSYEDLEESMSLDEVYATIETIMEQRQQEHTFMAALKGIDLDEHRKGEESTVEEIKKRAAQRIENEQRTMQLIAAGMPVEEARAESERVTEEKELADLGLVAASDGW